MRSLLPFDSPVDAGYFDMVEAEVPSFGRIIQMLVEFEVGARQLRIERNSARQALAVARKELELAQTAAEDAAPGLAAELAMVKGFNAQLVQVNEGLVAEVTLLRAQAEQPEYAIDMDAAAEELASNLIRDLQVVPSANYLKREKARRDAADRRKKAAAKPRRR